MPDTITIRRIPTGWAADFAQHSTANEVRSLFGTTELPTSYTPRATADYVRQALKRLNPGSQVLEAPRG